MSSVPRFFVTGPAAFDGDTITLPPEASRHALTVLRLRAGEAVTIHDNAGGAFDGVLLDGATSQAARVRVTARRSVETEPLLRITVAQALPKTPDKIEQVLQHGTEVGAAGFVFFPAERSVARLSDGEKIEKRLLRWQGIVRHAAEQSGRGILPTVAWTTSEKELTATFGSYDARLVLHESATVSLRVVLTTLPETTQALLLLVGPEGGFSPGEVARFEAAKASVVSLGPRVLRTETAALVALSQTLFA